MWMKDGLELIRMQEGRFRVERALYIEALRQEGGKRTSQMPGWGD